MTAVIMMATLKSYCLTHMPVATLLACAICGAEDGGGISRTGGRDQPVRALKEKQQKNRKQTDRQTSDKKRHTDLIKEDKGTWSGLLQYAAHAPDVAAEGGQALLQVLAVAHIRQHPVKEHHPRRLLLLLLLVRLLQIRML